MLYLDAVLDSRMNVLYNGTPEDTVKWLGNVVPDQTWQVCRGSDMVTVSVEVYLTAYRECKEAVLRGKRQKIRELVAEAVKAGAEAEASSTPSLDAINREIDEITAKIVDLL